MTSPAIQLAKASRMPKFMIDTQDCRNALERFYTLAQAQALRDAAMSIHPAKALTQQDLMRMAEELEK